MTVFEKVTATPEALGDFLASLMAIDTPWEDAFHETFCAECGRDNCDEKRCPFEKERDNPTWWLMLGAEGEEDTHHAALIWRNGRVKLEPGVIVPLESPLRVLIRAAKIENPFGEMPTGKEVGARLETAWQTAEEVKKVHPNAEISVEVEV